MNLRLYLRELEERFQLEKAVCNHGFFMMAPNIWNPLTKSLSRPLTLSNSSFVNVTISHPPTLSFLVIQVHGINNVSRVDEELILQQVRRMLRLSADDELDVTKFQQLHEAAKKNGFGRIFRSPSLFEDMVKSILLCNTTWERTLDMASKLCDLQLKLADGTLRPPNESKKRKRVQRFTKETKGNFPSAKEIAILDKEFINKHCKLGYRARWIVKLAKMVESGSLNLEEMEKREMEDEEIYGKLRKLKGFGDFVSATVLMCIGYYHLVPSILFFLYYRFDLVQNYETKLGKLSELSQLDYTNVSGCSYKKQPNVQD